MSSGDVISVVNTAIKTSITTSVKTLEVNVPAGITSPEDIFRVLSDGLEFPSYFGRNWDALFDCLCDFSWMKQRTHIVIRHHDVPPLAPVDRDAYLKVLSDAVGSWRANPGDHALEVRFPSKEEPNSEGRVTR